MTTRAARRNTSSSSSGQSIARKPHCCKDCGAPLPTRRSQRCPACAAAWSRRTGRVRKQFENHLKRRKAKKTRVVRTCQRCGDAFTCGENSPRIHCISCTIFAETPRDPIHDPPPPSKPTQTVPGRPIDCDVPVGRLGDACDRCTRTDCRIRVYGIRVSLGLDLYHPQDGLPED